MTITWHAHGKGGGLSAFVDEMGADVPAQMGRHGEWSPKVYDSEWFHLSISAPGDWARDEDERDEPVFRWVVWAESERAHDYYGTDYLVAGDSLTEEDARADVEAIVASRLSRVSPLVLVHADGGACHGRPVVSGRCTGCGIAPDMQSTELLTAGKVRR